MNSHSGLDPESSPKPENSIFRHWIPASTGMMFVLFALRINRVHRIAVSAIRQCASSLLYSRVGKKLYLYKITNRFVTHGSQRNKPPDDILPHTVTASAACCSIHARPIGWAIPLVHLLLSMGVRASRPFSTTEIGQGTCHTAVQFILFSTI
jgi:hypothetical protein